MKKRRYSLTQNDGELVIAALEIVISELSKDYTNLTVREMNQVTACRILKQKLESYQWEV